ncbi:hypothetical protein M3661_21575 [Paenibacillus sp. MER 180]|uniref:hypothetical protein n=1 Tax=Paenibacillus sp. MER 180 TaxID=2939570 RepID=UPI0020416771|nr:hypothetical protein [Paenibacillus sp. MER 180]MCM3292709.1 hypothetical protein [Paenibacillus sp. MER 180]
MKEKTKKRFAVSALVLSAMLMLPAGAFAASSNSTSGTAGDVNTHGSLSIYSDYASGSTSASDRAYCKVDVVYTYSWGLVGSVYTKEASDTAAYSTSAWASANSDWVNPKSLRANAAHLVGYGSNSWTGSTYVTY